MRILFDNGTPEPLARAMKSSQVTFLRERGWEHLGNGDLLRLVEDAGFDLLLTTDRRIRYQQNLAGRKIAIIVITGCTFWHRVKLYRTVVAAAVEAAAPGSYTEVPIPFR
jgi:hypothetical protein